MTRPTTQPKIGDTMTDGTIYAGVSPDNGRKMFALCADAPLTMTFNEAERYAQGMITQKPHGHDDWRVPTKGELTVLFNNRAAIGGFNASVSGSYWSSSLHSERVAWCQQFRGSPRLKGRAYLLITSARADVRLVRTEAPKKT